MENSVQSVYERIKEEAQKVIVGQTELFEMLVVSLFSGGHVLLEGVPGTAKTLMAKTLAMVISGKFSRVQFTPDLMPSDIVGTSVYDLTTNQFNLKRGPVFTNVLLADEINRAPAKTQSALLECMEERQVSIDGVRHELDPPFIVLATQNPIEYEGTYPLPEAQLDRFLFKLNVDYPGSEMETQILINYHQGFNATQLEDVGIENVVDSTLLQQCKTAIQDITVEESIFNYIVNLAEASRNSNELVLGGSPRASIALLLASKTYAAMKGRDYILPDDVKFLAPHVYRHRILLKADAEIEGLTPDDVIDRLLAEVEIPR
ncbi:MoxR family ATPase [Candidatus Poribacteria bacterium]|nr:MoxR family ATPase [Candidatus Poribacteria bacterium]MYF56068.1 MoxR family ATPase [Candidatus Poribacteria bacterium]